MTETLEESVARRDAEDRAAMGEPPLPEPPPPAPETLADPEAETRERFRPEPETDEERDESGGVPQFTLEDVGRFAYERQAIWHRRFVQGAPAPWTEDEVLREWRICNIYRELDKGTQFCREHVAERHRGDGELEDQKARLLNTAVYRLLNRTESWERYVGWLEPPYDEAIKDAVGRLEQAVSEGEVVSTATWRARSLVETARSMLAVASRLDEIHLICSVATSLQMVHALLNQVCEIGEFIAYQVALDLQFVYPNLDNSDWVFVGGRNSGRNNGGSAWALKQISPGEIPIDVCRRLRDTQDEWLPAEWAEVAPDFRPRLALVDVDNVMCEFRKYWLKRHGKGSLTRYGDEPPAVRRRRSSGEGRSRGSSTNWETPPELFAQLNEEFQFTVDAAASDSNALLARYWTVSDDGTRQSWDGERVFCHAPLGDARVWTEKASRERQRAELSVLLVPVATDTKWWHDNVLTADEIRFVGGQTLFNEGGNPRPNTYVGGIAIVVWRREMTEAPDTPWRDYPLTSYAYTWPGRHRLAHSGWPGPRCS